MPSFTPSGGPISGTFSSSSTDSPDAFISSNPVPIGSYNGGTNPNSGPYDGIRQDGFSGTYGEIGITYGDQSTLFHGILGVWRYGGFLPIFSPRNAPSTGVFDESTANGSGSFQPSSQTSGGFSPSPPNPSGGFTP